MPNWIFSQLLDEQIARLVASFEISKKIFTKESEGLIHPGEFGVYRQTICSEFLSYFSPGSLEISTGFVISANDEVSTQCDIIIYDKDSTPLIQQGQKQRFFPIESVVAVGEVKSNVRKAELKVALEKLSRIKSMRSNLNNPKIIKANRKRDIPQFSTVDNKSDQIFTFLICNAFDYNFKDHNNDIDLISENIDFKLRHNTILSIKDGIYLYVIPENLRQHIRPELLDERGKLDLFYHPNMKTFQLESIIMEADQKNSHIRAFASYFHQGVSSTTVCAVDVVNYIGSYFNNGN